MCKQFAQMPLNLNRPIRVFILSKRNFFCRGGMEKKASGKNLRLRLQTKLVAKKVMFYMRVLDGLFATMVFTRVFWGTLVVLGLAWERDWKSSLKTILTPWARWTNSHISWVKNETSQEQNPYFKLSADEPLRIFGIPKSDFFNRGTGLFRFQRNNFSKDSN